MFYYCILTLLVTSVLFNCEALKCFTCSDCVTNEDALRNWTECEPGQACSSSYTANIQGGIISVRKRCENICQFPGLSYQISARGLRYCCTTDFCNSQLQPESVEEISTEAPAVTCEKGEKGDRGLPGIDGRLGLNGLPGIPGPRGPLGGKGDKGDGCSPSDCAGRYSDVSFPGQKGEPGRPGLDGFSGLPGLPGQKGVAGNKGEPGMAANAENCSCSEVSATKSVAFHGVASNVRQTSDNSEPIFFDEILVNEGSLLDTTNKSSKWEAIFEVPTSGLYVIMVTSKARGHKATPTELIRNGTYAVLSTASLKAPLSELHDHVITKLEIGEILQFQIPGSSLQLGDKFDNVERPFNEIEKTFNIFTSPSNIHFSMYLLG